MSWTPRTTAPTYGTLPYDWNAYTRYQCTWYAYWRVQEEGLTPPVWQTGSGSSGSGYYNNAKTWLDHYRDPWQVKPVSGYSPVPGDIIIFTGTYGHCVVVESDNGNGTLTVTDYNLIAGDDTFGRKTDYVYGNRIYGATQNTGACIGALHYPGQGPGPGPGGIIPEITIAPSSYNVSMISEQDLLDFNFNIVINGIPDGESASGGNTYPGLERVYNTGWSYTSYTGSDGNTYLQAVKSQTLRYNRERLDSYTVTKHMYFDLDYSNGSIHSDTPITINVEISVKLIAVIIKTDKEGEYMIKLI